jgi:hypothetical protein
MAAAQSPVDVCNLALDDLKQRPITSIVTPVSDTEYVCARNYDNTRREALFAHPWKFAITRVQLTPNPNTVPLFGYKYAYDLPNDYLRMISVGNDAYGNSLIREREVESNQILNGVQEPWAEDDDSGCSNSPTLDLRYMRDVTEVTQFSPGFLTYFRLLLAIRMSNKFSTSATIKKGIMDDFEEVQTAAKAINGQENRIRRIQVSRVMMKRRGLQSGAFASKYVVFDQ